VATFVAALVVFAVVTAAMALGVIIQGKRLRGSCGGTGKDCECSPLAARGCPLRRLREQRSPTIGDVG
jgi:hypothetical protein